MILPSLNIELNTLYQGVPALTPAMAGVLGEACIYELEEIGRHTSGVVLILQGELTTTICITWQNGVNDSMRRSYTEQKDTTQWAACGLALLLVLNLTEYTAIERSWIGTGFDYWLGLQDEAEKNFFQNKARLEVSGIRKGTEGDVNSRVNQKLEQTKISDSTGLPAFVLVTEFSKPVSHIVKRV